jgi:UDP-N-acetylmuramoyl-tripeptide--D-alanyl-D-alanine ligase
MKYGLDTLSAIRSTGRKVAVLGDMLELGDMSAQLHRQVGVHVASADPDLLVTCGDLAREIAHGALEHGFPSERHRHFPDTDYVIDCLLAYLRPGDTVLIKASRSMAFDRITLGLRSQLGRNN